MKFGQLIEYNLGKIFLEKSYRKYGGKASPSLSWKIEIEHISGSAVRNVIKALKKQKRGLVSLPHFLHDFWREILLMLYLIKFHYLITFTFGDIGQYATIFCNCIWFFNKNIDH